MTLAPDTAAEVDRRIRRLLRPGPARDELRDHVEQALLARSDEPGPADVADVFAVLGPADEVRAAFQPRRPRTVVRWWSIALLVVAALTAAWAIEAEDGSASCVVEGPGTCEASSDGQAMTAALWAAAPLVVLAALVWLPRWAAAALSAALASLVLIVLATRGDTLLVQFLLGSVAAVTVAAVALSRPASGATA